VTDRPIILCGVAGEHVDGIAITLALSDNTVKEYRFIDTMTARRLAADLDRAIADAMARKLREPTRRDAD
jgi:hypothetical protein